MRSTVPLTLLEMLAAFETEKSVSAVAQSLGLSQPTVSSNLTRLEQHVGSTLVHRSPNGSYLTSEGQAVLAWSRPVLLEAAKFERTLASLREAPAQRLRVAASLTIAEQLVPRWLSSKPHGIPSESIELTVQNSENVMALISQGEVDIGFVEGTSVRPELSRQVIGHDELIVIFSPQHHWAHRSDPVTVDELLSAELVVREEGSGTREVLETALQRMGRQLPQQLPNMSSTSSIKNSVRFGQKIAVVSRLAVAEEIARGELISIKIEGMAITRRLQAVWDKTAPLSANAQNFLRRAKQTL